MIYYWILNIILLIYIFCNINKKEQFADNLTITIGIPCIPRDITKLDRLFKSIENQTHKPLEVILALSEVTKDNADIYEKEYNNKYSFKIKIVSTEEQCYAAKNRNRIIPHINGDLISFIDADDAMHPERLEKISEIFKEYNNMDGLLHTHSLDYKRFPKLQKYPKIYYLSDVYKMVKETENKHLYIQPDHLNNNELSELHHGHITCKTNIFNFIKYNESNKYRRGQDSLLVRDIVNYLTKIYINKKNTLKTKKQKKLLERQYNRQFIIVDLPLTQYIPAMLQ